MEPLARYVRLICASILSYPALTLTLGVLVILGLWLFQFLFGSVISFLFWLPWQLLRLVYYSPLIYIFVRSAWIILRRVLRRANQYQRLGSLYRATEQTAVNYVSGLQLPHRILAWFLQNRRAEQSQASI